MNVSAGADDFDSFVVFVESIVGKGFISLLDSLMQKVIIDILHRAGDSSEWVGGYALPAAVLDSAKTALVNLSDIQSKSDAANFLAGKNALFGMLVAMHKLLHAREFFRCNIMHMTVELLCVM